MQVHAVEHNQFFHCSLNCKGRSDTALIMAGISVTVSDRNGDTGLRSGRSAPECKCVLAGKIIVPVGCTGTACTKCPAQARITGAEELVRIWHASLRISPCWT